MRINTQQKLLEFHEEITTKARELMSRKNNDYAGSDDPFRNFMVVEQIGVCNAQTGLMVRLSDKLSRAATYINSGELKCKDESIMDTIKDGINYFVLLAAYLEERAGKFSDDLEYKVAVDNDGTIRY